MGSSFLSARAYGRRCPEDPTRVSLPLQLKGWCGIASWRETEEGVGLLCCHSVAKSCQRKVATNIRTIEIIFRASDTHAEREIVATVSECRAWVRAGRLIRKYVSEKFARSKYQLGKMSDRKKSTAGAAVDTNEQTLNNELREIARKDLNEDKSSRRKALAEMRAWIKTTPGINHCRTDNSFLLRFLRMQKFDIKESQNILEKYLTMRCQYPAWFQNLDCRDPSLKDLVDSGYIFVLPGRDSLGRRVIFSQAGAMDPARFTSSDILRSLIMTFETLLVDEENQVRGFTYIFDEKAVGWSHLSVWTPSEVTKAFSCCERALPKAC